MKSMCPVTAILLAGGTSRRMGREKAFLDINGRPLIQHIYDQLFRHFTQVVISSNNKEKFLFLGASIIQDKIPDFGPLMGISSALEASDNDINFVIACDIPDINISFIHKMVNSCSGYDGVVPLNSRSQPEPLYAIYRKSMLTAMNNVLLSGKKKISDVYKLCKIKYIIAEDLDWLNNLNTFKDYEEYIKKYNSSK